MAFTVRINGADRVLEVDGASPLAWALRDLDMRGPKYDCYGALCGACTVHLDGQPVRACITPVQTVGAKAVTTVEAMSNDPVGAKVQRAWFDIAVERCGFCVAGQIMSATALLTANATPTDDDIAAAMAGNRCNCTTALHASDAIKQAAGLTTA